MFALRLIVFVLSLSLCLVTVQNRHFRTRRNSEDAIDWSNPDYYNSENDENSQRSDISDSQEREYKIRERELENARLAQEKEIELRKEEIQNAKLSQEKELALREQEMRNSMLQMEKMQQAQTNLAVMEMASRMYENKQNQKTQTRWHSTPTHDDGESGISALVPPPPPPPASSSPSLAPPPAGSPPLDSPSARSPPPPPPPVTTPASKLTTAKTSSGGTTVKSAASPRCSRAAGRFRGLYNRGGAYHRGRYQQHQSGRWKTGRRRC